jgi:pimeloyl-ACP methyl ester carboxylesterase
MLMILLALNPVFTGKGTIAGATGIMAKQDAPSVKNITSIQAFSDFCFYGQKLTRVEITYKAGTNLSGLRPESYTLLDRGYANPDFTKIRIQSLEVKAPKVTLHITKDTEAMPTNTLAYIGDNANGSRTKNPLGVYVTGPWYRGMDGHIYFGKKDSADYKGNPSGDGYQTRPCLELKLFHAGETETDAACMAHNNGTYNSEDLWLPAIDANYGEEGFQSFETLGIAVPTTATDGEKFVRGWAYFPRDYDKNRSEKYPLIIAITGYGTSFWRHDDGTHNFGTGLNFDGSAFRWMNGGAIVLNIHDRSHTGGDTYKFYVDDYNVIQHFIQQYNADPTNITLTGNSRGTIACNTIAATYPGLIHTLILNNGSMGSGIAGKEMFTGKWTDTEWQTAAKNGTRIWAFDGEQDTDNQENLHKAFSYYKAAGWSDEWIAKNIRLTGFPTGLYHYWGETDHSTTKMTYWYFFDKPWYGPDAKIENGNLIYITQLKPGDTYRLKGRLVKGKYNKEDFDYTVYGNSLREWVVGEGL